MARRRCRPWNNWNRQPLADPATFRAGEDILSFVTEDRNIVCSLTSARGGHVNLPYEQNSFSDPANNKLATVPVAHCELAVYPKPAPRTSRTTAAGRAWATSAAPRC